MNYPNLTTNTNPRMFLPKQLEHANQKIQTFSTSRNKSIKRNKDTINELTVIVQEFLVAIVGVKAANVSLVLPEISI